MVGKKHWEREQCPSTKASRQPQHLPPAERQRKRRAALSKLGKRVEKAVACARKMRTKIFPYGSMRDLAEQVNIRSHVFVVFCEQYVLGTIVAIKNTKSGIPRWYIVDIGLPRMVAVERGRTF